MVVPRGEGYKEGKVGKGVTYMVTEGDETSGGEREVEYRDVQL